MDGQGVQMVSCRVEGEGWGAEGEGSLRRLPSSRPGTLLSDGPAR